MPNIYGDDVKMDNLDASWLTKTIIEDKYKKNTISLKHTLKTALKQNYLI